MSFLEPTPAKVEALRQRWRGQGWRLRAIADDLVRGGDWTRHLQGLPYVEEVAPLPGERVGRDLRGADLAQALRPEVAVLQAGLPDVASIARVLHSAHVGRGPLGAAVPIGSPPEDIGALEAAIRRGDVFLLVALAGRTAGVVRVLPAAGARAADAGEIADLAVRPRFQGLGVGSRLLAEAEATLTSWGLVHATLRAIPEAGRVAWYERRGYRVTRLVQRQPRGGAAHLEAQLEKTIVPQLGGASQAQNRASGRTVRANSNA
ncbi:MAG: GNAT family N-acetyltransferase [Planctomycetes bacterium]|nr:GNAT family N-acetyltransferase [Planctomycetota bacterium]MCB9826129.1 GNAT family N-acetyltransferase [Planctomycetota bacterium]MCB9828435.1 GNAT family N-acetyltransferase [Planctomycetota bacterium]MCB9902509.1 GNAT family N-acetyltransferase [Planctomycetota bacterium]